MELLTYDIQENTDPSSQNHVNLMANTAHAVKFCKLSRVYPFHVLLYAQCTLIICYRMRSVRLFFITVCAVYACFLLPYAQGT